MYEDSMADLDELVRCGQPEALGRARYQNAARCR